MTTIQSAEIPSLQFTEDAAPATPAAGLVVVYAKADGLLYQKDDAGTETVLAGGGGGGGGSSIPTAQVIYAGGSVAYNNASFTELSSALRLTLAAVADDVIEVSLCAFVSNENQTLRFDIATIVAGAIVRRIANSSNGIGGMLCDQAVTQRATGAIQLTAAAGDISGGNCIVSVACSSTGSRTVVATTETPIVFCAKNLGQ